MKFCMRCGKSGTGNYCPDCGGRIRSMTAIARKKRGARRHNFTVAARLGLGMDAIGGHIAEACWWAAELIADRKRGRNDAYTAGGGACKTPEELNAYLEEVEQTAQRIMDDVVKHVDERKEEPYGPAEGGGSGGAAGYRSEQGV